MVQHNILIEITKKTSSVFQFSEKVLSDVRTEQKEKVKVISMHNVKQII
jgi:hypothetical protein